MARVTLSIPDEMHARIQSARDGMNFSALARDAFERAFRMADAGKLSASDETIERLRLSKLDAKEQGKKVARKRARAWVRNDASYWQLKALEDAPFDPKNTVSQLTTLFFGDENPQDAQEWFDGVFGEGGVSDSDLFEFLVTVGKIWGEIKDRVDAEETAVAA